LVLMATTQKQEETDPCGLKHLPSNIDQLSLSIQHFSLGMLTSYECATNANEFHQFKTLRCLLVEDASVYSQHVVPYSKIVFQKVYETFDMIEGIENIDDFTLWVEDLTTETENIHSALLFVSKLNLQALETAQSRDIVAKKLVHVLKLQEEEKKMKLVSNELSISKNTLTGLPKPKTEAEIKELISNYTGRESAAIARALVSDVIVPALSFYVDALEKVVRILANFLLSTKNLSTRLNNFQTTTKETTLVLYFNCARRIASEIKTASKGMNGFYDVCNTKFNAMKSLDQSYSFAQEIELFASIDLDKPKEEFTKLIKKIIAENTTENRLNLEYPTQSKKETQD